MRVIGTKILVEQFTTDEISKGGIVIPEQYRQETWWCKVISIGGKVKAGLVAVGMPVLIKAHHGVIIEHDGHTYRSVEVDDIIGTLPEAAGTPVPSESASEPVRESSAPSGSA